VDWLPTFYNRSQTAKIKNQSISKHLKDFDVKVYKQHFLLNNEAATPNFKFTVYQKTYKS
jgi:hypothetical protein